MSVRSGHRWVARIGAATVVLSLALIAVGVVNAGSGDPSSISVTKTGTLSVSASGTWSWPEMSTNKKLSWAGFALDWGDVTTGNDVPKPGGGAYHVGDGTSATNFVLHPTNPAQGASGSFGPVMHTYAAPGVYKVCVILYDLGETMPFKATGYHGLRAGGTARNTDNSVEQNGDVKNNCTTVDLTTPSESIGGETATPVVTAMPSQSVAGVTSGPQTTPPPTSTDAPDQPANPSLIGVLLLLVGGSMLGFAVFASRPAPRRRS